MISIFSKIKYLLSFIVDFPVEKIRSSHHKLEVRYYKGEYMLNTSRLQYSFGVYYRPFAAAFKQIAITPHIKEVLVLGLGMGSVPKLIFQKGVHPHYTCVEFDSHIIKLARKYLNEDIINSMNIFEEDAFQFVQNAGDKKYDLIAMDIFIEDVIPSQFQTKKFLIQLERLLTPKGILLYNRLVSNYELKKESETYYTEVFNKQFPNSYTIEANNNWVLVYKNGSK